MKVKLTILVGILLAITACETTKPKEPIQLIGTASLRYKDPTGNPLSNASMESLKAEPKPEPLPDWGWMLMGDRY